MQVSSDGRTVWVNDELGGCVARLGPFRVDVHRSTQEQIATGVACSDCYVVEMLGSMAKHGDKVWNDFVESVEALHGVVIDRAHRPSWTHQ